MGAAAIKNLKAILFTHQIIAMPMVIWLMVSFFESIPGWNQFLFSLILSGPKQRRAVNLRLLERNDSID